MRIVAALMLVLLTLPAFAQDGDRARRIEQAQMFVELTTADSVMAPMLDAMWPTVEMQLPSSLNPEVTARFKETFTTEIVSALSDVFDELAVLYADNFTLDELMALNKFYAGGAGAKLLANQGRLMQEMLPTLTARLTETMPGAIQRLMEQAEEEGLIGD
jgi:hypothetical protein